jgi:hypothetical protein
MALAFLVVDFEKVIDESFQLVVHGALSAVRIVQKLEVVNLHGFFLDDDAFGV